MPDTGCKITVNAGRAVLHATPGQSLLDALRIGKLFLTSACGGRGACGTCKVKITSGTPPPLTPSEKHWLKEDEKAAGIRLSCQLKPEADLDIAIPDEVFGMHEYTADVLSIRKLTYDIKQIRLKLVNPAAMEFHAGQYVQILHPATAGTDKPCFRSYSIATDPTVRGEIELHVRLVPKGFLSTFIHDQLREGDRLTLVGPAGSFFLRGGSRDLLFIAGGSGMAPVKAVLHQMLNLHDTRRARYYFGAKTTQDLFLVNAMRDLEKMLPDFKFVPALSDPQPNENWTGETGLITDVVDRHIDQADNVDAYLCGSPMMITACMKVLKAKGIPDDRIFFDKFL